MFTGIIEEVGTIERLVLSGQTGVLQVKCHRISQDLKAGDSIAVNGVCLTAVSFSSQGFAADTSAETLRLGARNGGHLVSGHVDGVGRLLGVVPEGESYRFQFELPPDLDRYVVLEGSIAVDGISLTVARLGPGSFETAVIPFTLRETNLGRRKPGDQVNLEVDMLGRYVEKLLARSRAQTEQGEVNEELLRNFGFLGEEG